VSKTVNLWKQQKLDLQVNIYNLLNDNAVQAVQVRSGSTFGLPIASGGVTILQPRIVQVGATYRF
jgi:outer membrane receptor protein involved in Fe transport